MVLLGRAEEVSLVKMRYVSKPGAVAKLRQGRFMRQEDLAASAEVSTDVIYRMERGPSSVSVQSVNKVAAALGVEPSEIAEPAVAAATA